MHHILEELKKISGALENESYKNIYNLIRALPNKCVPTAKLHKGWFIDRIRINDPSDIVFTSIDDISHHTNAELFHLIGRGRCNDLGQPIFYGSIVSPEIEVPRLVAYLETSTLQKEIEKRPNDPTSLNVEETFTMSRWKIKEDMEVVEMILSEEALKVSQYAKDALKNQLQNLGNSEHKEHCIEQLKFFSEEFARRDINKTAEDHYETYKYKISAAYFNYILDRTNFQGITYPSVSTKYFGQNVALKPSAVEQFLELESIAMFKFQRINGVNLPIDCFRVATNLGVDKKGFVWNDYHPSEK